MTAAAQRAVWRLLTEGATKGPWELTVRGGSVTSPILEKADPLFHAAVAVPAPPFALGALSILCESVADARFIAAARTAVPLLLDVGDVAVQALREIAKSSAHRNDEWARGTAVAALQAIKKLEARKKNNG